MADNTPKQEGGRFSPKGNGISRANKSFRLFEHVVTSLSEGRQPDMDLLAFVGYLMRTTAVYGSGKILGFADREKILIDLKQRAPFPDRNASSVSFSLVYN
ncbi:MAG: hypothetical protein CM1200mP30_23560 [Pseudomonadota bacterium]|nr:MAG: hypothetical protein CM1200mP30_23560 [Pseudomonadota bacterium]